MDAERVFKAKSGRFFVQAGVILIGGAALGLFYYKEFSWGLFNLVVIALVWRGFRPVFYAQTVIVGNDGLEVRPFLPFLKTHRLSPDEMLSYGRAVFPWRRDSPWMGIVQAKSGKPVVLWPQGIKDFEVLDDILQKLLPPTPDSKEPENRDDPV